MSAKNDLTMILNALHNERIRLEEARRDLDNQLRTTTATRGKVARDQVAKWLPDLRMGTVKELRTYVPNFPIPMVSAWCRLSEKVDPRMTVDMLRIQLLTYLDNMRFPPDAWRLTVNELDASIKTIQSRQIPDNVQGLSEIKDRISAMERLAKTDFSRMEPIKRQQIETSLAQQAKNIGRGQLRPIQIDPKRPPPSYPSTTVIHSDSGPSLLEYWLWYHILSEHGEVHQEVYRVESSGDFGGGGASGDFGGGTSDSTGRTEDSAVGIMPAVAVTSDDRGLGSDLSAHDALGAQSFS